MDDSRKDRIHKENLIEKQKYQLKISNLEKKLHGYEYLDSIYNAVKNILNQS